MERQFIKRNTKNQKLLAGGALSPIVLDYIMDSKVPKPCRHFIGRDKEMLIYQATKRVSQYVLKDEKEFVEQLKAQYELQCEKKRQERATKKKKIALAELKEQAEKGNQEAVRELEERRAIARERSRESAEKSKQRAENDPEYAKYLEERNAEYNRRHTARRKEQMEALRARAEAGDQEAQSQLAERKQYQVRATVKSYRKMREDALNGDPIAKERYEKTLTMRREAYHSKKSEQTA